jgi:hypothetical protein
MERAIVNRQRRVSYLQHNELRVSVPELSLKSEAAQDA